VTSVYRFGYTVHILRIDIRKHHVSSCARFVWKTKKNRFCYIAIAFVVYNCILHTERTILLKNLKI